MKGFFGKPLAALLKKTAVFSVVTLLSLGTAYGFEWPQENIDASSFYSYFAQLRGGTVCSSLIFSESAEVHAAEDGYVAAVIVEHTDDFGWFESTLGNAVIVSHEDNLVSVYANLDEDSLAPVLESGEKLSKETVLGESGNSGWQKGMSCLEFMVLDTEKATAINPRILMPRLGGEKQLEMGQVTVDDKRGITHALAVEKYFSSGRYSVYHTRQDVAMPYRTVIAVNGATVENIVYDTLKESGGRLCALGNRPYTVEQLYPDDKRHLLGVVDLPHGHTVLTVTLINIFGHAVTSTYNLEVN